MRQYNTYHHGVFAGYFGCRHAVSERPDTQNRFADAPGMVDARRDRLSVRASQQAALRQVATRLRFLRKSTADDLRL